jgi:hypothetical protein
VNTAVFSDALMPDLIEAYNTQLQDIRFTKEQLLQALERTKAQFPDYGEYISETADFLVTSLEL